LEALGTLIYEVQLDGGIEQAIVHPDDPDGFPGKGASAPSSDVALAPDPLGLGDLYVTGGDGRLDSIRRIHGDGDYSGFDIPIARAGGRVSGFLVQDFVAPGGRLVSPAVILAVESSAEIVVLEGGEGDIGEVFAFTCAGADGSVQLS